MYNANYTYDYNGDGSLLYIMRIVAFPTPSQTEVQRNNQNMEVCMSQPVRNCLRVIQKFLFFLTKCQKTQNLVKNQM